MIILNLLDETKDQSEFFKRKRKTILNKINKIKDKWSFNLIGGIFVWNVLVLHTYIR